MRACVKDRKIERERDRVRKRKQETNKPDRQTEWEQTDRGEEGKEVGGIHEWVVKRVCVGVCCLNVCVCLCLGRKRTRERKRKRGREGGGAERERTGEAERLEGERGEEGKKEILCCEHSNKCSIYVYINVCKYGSCVSACVCVRVCV